MLERVSHSLVWLVGYGEQVKKVKKRPAEGEAGATTAARNPFQAKLDAKKAQAKRVRFTE
jgi:hypothetical protein